MNNKDSSSGGVMLVRNGADKRGTYIMMPSPPSNNTNTNNPVPSYQSPGRKYKSGVPPLEIDQLNSTTSILNALISSDELNPFSSDTAPKKQPPSLSLNLNGLQNSKKTPTGGPPSSRGSTNRGSVGGYNSARQMYKTPPSHNVASTNNTPRYQYYPSQPQIGGLVSSSITNQKSTMNTPRNISPNTKQNTVGYTKGTTKRIGTVSKTNSTKSITSSSGTKKETIITANIGAASYLTPRPPVPRKPSVSNVAVISSQSYATEEPSTVSSGHSQTTAPNSARRYNFANPSSQSNLVPHPPTSGASAQPPTLKLNLNLQTANYMKDVEFEGFGSGVPETVKTARNTTAKQQPSMPMSARAANAETTSFQNLPFKYTSEDKTTVFDVASSTSTTTSNQQSNPSSRSSSVRSIRTSSSNTGGNVNLKFHDPITPAAAIKMYSDYLTDYEQSEIFDFHKVYCIGSTARKIKGTVNANEEMNFGYDDERGDYKLVLNDHIGYRYEVVGFLGKGSFGQVVKAHDVKENKFVALKVIRNRKRFHAQALVEVKILKHLKDNDKEGKHHCIEMVAYFTFRQHLCIAFELLSINLYEFIKNNNFRGLSLALIRKFALQILNSLQYLSQEKIIHCDLKPENILLVSSTKSDIKMIDFGSSCFENERIYTYIQSRFYRSPEIILGISYGRSIDMWSFGCILAELYTGYPLFPGRNELEQLCYIMEVMGMPSKKLIQISTRRKKFFDSNGQPRLVINKKTGKKRIPGSVTLQQALDCPDRKFVSFMEACLRWDPVERMTPEEAFRHEWILEALAPSK
ncbi:predicted protein [Naegleria gruberi]|uniref:dual-specificity kinase n=1 Tax=Naegleria gruberi TaxID=5762 RepID=D2W3M6_NAEGR|nr:uncharacterized protein NAEGRDRAFT_82249 [Naegleria gruberi]EFC36361.1 predicted protein [Naegleria gruberi]|eukprot:XP_002669105.1 predicted protein [Naegleria gruberi strain NEG-M]